MPLFEVDKDTKRVEEIKPRTFPELRLWERQDLEAWVTSAPDLAGGDFTVVTSEFDRFDRTSERLDVLGIVPIDPGHGRLVVVLWWVCAGGAGCGGERRGMVTVMEREGAAADVVATV